MAQATSGEIMWIHVMRLSQSELTWTHHVQIRKFPAYLADLVNFKNSANSGEFISGPD